MFRIETGQNQNRGKLVLGEDGLQGQKFLLYCRLLGWSRSDGRTSGPLRGEEEGGHTRPSWLFPILQWAGACFLLRACVLFCSYQQVSWLLVPALLSPTQPSAVCEREVWQPGLNPSAPAQLSDTVYTDAAYLLSFFISDWYSVCISV